MSPVVDLCKSEIKKSIVFPLMQRRKCSLAVLASLALAAATLCASPVYSKTTQNLVLTDQKVAPQIVLAFGATESEKYAAHELAFHLEKISGKKVETVVSNILPETQPNRHSIILGHHPLNHYLQPGKLDVEESIVDVRGDAIHIVGGKKPPIKDGAGVWHVRDRGTLYGVYNFLDALGVRWYAPGDENTYIPSKKTIDLKIGQQFYKPIYRYRYGQFLWSKTDSPQTAWAVRNRMNVDIGTGLPKFGGSEGVSFNHNYASIIPQWKYYKTHPEYFALIDRKRSEHVEAQLCLSNPEVQEIMAQYVVGYAKLNPWRTVISVEPNDGALWCECDNCKLLDDPNLIAYASGKPSMSNRVAFITNLIAKRLAAEVPGVSVGRLSYLMHTEKPSIIKEFEPNIAMQATTIVGYGDYSKKLTDANSRPNRMFINVLRNQQAQTQQNFVYEYWGGYAWAGPLPILTVMHDRLNNYHRNFNVVGVYNESVHHWNTQNANYYFYPRLMWNPNRDMKKELREYCRNYYGPAAKAMEEYFWLLEEASLKGPEYYSGGYMIEPLFTTELVGRMKPPIEAAVRAAQNSGVYQERVRGAWLGYELSRLTNLFEGYKRTHQVQKALDTWDETEALLKDEKNKFSASSIIYFKQPMLTALRQQLEMFKSYPDAKALAGLDEDWRFETDPQDKGIEAGWNQPVFADEKWRTLTATKWWNQQGVSYYGSAWYRKSFTVPALEKGKEALLFFGAVDGDALVYMNGQKVGERLLGSNGEGWDQPIVFNATPHLKAGENQLSIRVTKRSAMAGIYQGVTLFEATPKQ